MKEIVGERWKPHPHPPSPKKKNEKKTKAYKINKIFINKDMDFFLQGEHAFGVVPTVHEIIGPAADHVLGSTDRGRELIIRYCPITHQTYKINKILSKKKPVGGSRGVGWGGGVGGLSLGCRLYILYPPQPLSVIQNIC